MDSAYEFDVRQRHNSVHSNANMHYDFLEESKIRNITYTFQTAGTCLEGIPTNDGCFTEHSTGSTTLKGNHCSC